MAANWGNPKGYFETQEIADLHDELLVSVGSIWSDWRQFPASWYDSPDAERYRLRLSAAFKENFGDAELSVFKEPRMCRLVPLWDRIFEDLALEPAFFFIDRSPIEVAASLQARDGSSMTQGLLYYLRNHLDAEYATRGRNRAFVSYSDFLGNWRSAIAAFSTKVGIRFPLTDDQQREVDAFLDPTLHHLFSGSIELPAGPVAVMADAVHSVFEELSADESALTALSHLDELRASFNRLPVVDYSGDVN
jgi:hypothetical protein